MPLRGGGNRLRGNKKKSKGRKRRMDDKRRGEGIFGISSANSMPVASMRMRMDDYAPPRTGRLLPKPDNKKRELPNILSSFLYHQMS